MEYLDMNIQFNKSKSIGKVLYVVEGGKTEPYLLHKIFCGIMDYQMETILRDKGYRKYNSKDNPNSRVIIINAEESNIKNIARDNYFLDKMFAELIETYQFDVDNAAIYYVFDRDSKSNTDMGFIKNLLSTLANSRDNGWNRQGLLLLSYPSIEAFTLSNFRDRSYESSFETGEKLKKYLQYEKINQSHISESTLEHAAIEIMNILKQLKIDISYLDSFGENNRKIFEWEERIYENENVYRALSLLIISLVDLGIMEINCTGMNLLHERQEYLG